MIRHTVKTLDASELGLYARKARRERGLTLAEMGKELGVSSSSIWKAENDDSGRYTKLQTRILEWAGFTVRGPLFEIEASDTND